MPQEYRDDTGGDAGAKVVDAVDLGTLGETGAPAAPAGGRKKRSDAGQSRGPTGRQAKSSGSTEKLDLAGYLDILQLAHGLVFLRTGIPETELSDEEADKLKKAIERVVRHYPIDVAQKTADWSALICCLLTVYGFRIVSYKVRTAQERQPPQRRDTSSAEEIMVDTFNGRASN